MFVEFGPKEMLHSFEPVGSHHPMMMGHYYGSYTTTACFVKKTFQSASHMLPITINICLKEGITCSVQGKSDGRLGSANVPITT